MNSVNAVIKATELHVTANLILAENASLIYSSQLGVEGELKSFIERQYLVLVWVYTFQKKKDACVYGKEHTAYNEKLK